MAESKQARKTPLTTIALSQEMADKLDKLLKEQYQGMKRKEFLEGAIEYFERTGYPLHVDQIDYTPLEQLTGRLEESAAKIEEENAIRQRLLTLFEDIKNKQLALPSGEMVQKVHTDNASLQAELTLTKQKLKSAIIELERCSSGLFTKPNKAVIEDLKL